MVGNLGAAKSQMKMGGSIRHCLAAYGAVYLILASQPAARAQALSAGEAEAQKTEERIASVRRDALHRYGDALSELQAAFQKAADLEGALAVRAERQRVGQDGTLGEDALVTEPKALRALQSQTLTKMQELVAQLVQDALPKLIEHKKALTVAGKLDDAIAVRGAIERLQNANVPVTPPLAGAVVTADTLLLAYAGDRGRADKTYKGQRFTVRGVLGGFRLDPANPKQFLLYLGGSGSSGATSWVQCGFSTGEYRFREEKQFNNTILVITPSGNEAGAVRVQKGQAMDVRGMCEGWDEVVRLGRCELGR